MSIQYAHAADLATLSLDAAIALDHIERQRTYDSSVLTRFIDGLMSPDHSNTEALDLFSDPISSDIFTFAVANTSNKPVTRVEDVERAMSVLLKDLRAVADGEITDKRVSLLKTFCLTLHQALLNELTPFKHQSEWASIKELTFA